jgi:hypothetical protein
LVALWKHRSKPAASGRKFTGEAKVLSITVRMSSRRAKLATSSSITKWTASTDPAMVYSVH